jgi:hypothetical protein
MGVIWNRRAGNLEHTLSWNTPSLATLETPLVLNDLGERVFVPDETSLNIDGAEGQPGQPLGVFQITRLFQLIRTSYIAVVLRLCVCIQTEKPEIDFCKILFFLNGCAYKVASEKTNMNELPH